MLTNKHINDNCTPRQLKLPLVPEKIVDISGLVYTFCDVMDYIDLTPSFATFGNFIRNELTTTIEQIFNDIKAYIFEQVLNIFGVKFERREEYAVEYLEKLLTQYFCGFNLYKYQWRI